MIDTNLDNVAFPEEWSDWVKMCLMKLCSFGAAEIGNFFNGAPESVAGIFEQQVDKAFSQTKNPIQEKNGPRMLGALVGSLEKHIASPEAIAMRKQLDDVIERVESMDPASFPTPRKDELIEKLKAMKPRDPEKDKLQKLISFLDDRNCELSEIMAQMGIMREQLLFGVKPVIDQSAEIFRQQKEVIDFCLRTAPDQPYEEKTAFFEAYTKAKKATKIKDPHSLSASEKMNMMTTMCWPNLAGFESASEYRAWLINIFGKPDLFNPAMVNQNCQRKGLEFKDGPGRPKITTNEK